MVFTTRLAGGRGGRNGFETELRRLGIIQKNSRPNHPTTCGKVERFQQTLKTWLRAQPTSPTTIAELQTLLDPFADIYNTTAPTAPCPSAPPPPSPTPPAPKPHPADAGADIHYRVRHDRVDKTGRVTLRHDGRLHHIGLGHEHARTPVLMLIADLDIRVIDATTGELLRHLTLDPTRDYQPLGRPPGPPPENHNSPNPIEGSGCPGCPETSHWWRG